ncbi:hypothetical protein CR969_01770 [Candidatus Saccharibacteria bacterium]|nr:MAG: hypothetical protein CR969_01770 [Candidatus Saccharibacteria bacterium]
MIEKTRSSVEVADKFDNEAAYERVFNGVLEGCSRAEACDQPDIIERAYRVRRLANMFAGRLIRPLDIQAASMAGIVRSVYDDEGAKSEAAKWALAEAITSPELSYQEGEHLTGLLEDMHRTKNASGEHRTKMAALGNYKPETMAMIADSYEGDIPMEVWKETQPLLDFDHMDEFAQSVKIEAIIIEACELIDNMINPPSGNQSYILQRVLEAESFYAPMAAALGLSSMASMLRGQANKIRLEKQLKHSHVEKAEQISQKIVRLGVDNIIRGVMGVDEDEAGVVSSVYSDGSDGLPVADLGNFVVDVDGSLMVGNYRLKDDGGLANKIDNYGGELSMDVVGAMIISNNLEQLAEQFAKFARRSLDRPDLQLKPAKSKTRPIYIQGTEEFVGAIEGYLSRAGVSKDQYQVKLQAQSGEPDSVEEYGYEKHKVAKVMMLDANGIPVEVQFITKQERYRSRFEEVAHIVHKYLKQFPEDISKEQRLEIVSDACRALKNIYDLKKNLGQSDDYDWLDSEMLDKIARSI